MNEDERPVRHTNPDAVAEAIIQEVGKKIVLALPLALGKAIHVANALYARAATALSISLRIVTGLTVTRPRPRSELERRFIGPVIHRTFGDCPELAYVEPLRHGTLPPNIEVNEFFLQAGDWLDAPLAQQGHISANYTHAVPIILNSGVNVIAQLVGKGERGGARHYNISGNTDLTLDLLAARRAGRLNFLLVGQVNTELPYMFGEAEISPAEFGHILESSETDFSLPGPPRRPISDVHYAMGMHIASLVPDGGTLQIGIGSLSHAIAQCLILRHRSPQRFAEILRDITPADGKIERHTGPFKIGLYASTEMFADAFLELFRAGVLKREVDGAVLDAAFFVGPRDFYRALRELPDADRAKFRMTSVSFVNELCGADIEERRRARVGARFINNAMMATLLGAVVSDGFEDGRVVSGVGGQYNFIAQALALDGARSVVALPSTRVSGGKTRSNIKWNYGHTTIPRHLRDIIVTEYGVADLRGRKDADVIVAMLAISDSRFHEGLLREATKAQKVKADLQIPIHAQLNTPVRIASALAAARKEGWMTDLPFGEDYTLAERRLMPALELLRSASKAKIAAILFAGIWRKPGPAEREALERLGLHEPQTLQEHGLAALVKGALAERHPHP
jgi:hypothetical protein